MYLPYEAGVVMPSDWPEARRIGFIAESIWIELLTSKRSAV